MNNKGPDTDTRNPTALKVSQLEDIFENALESIARIDRQGSYLSVNSRFADTFGYTVDEMIGLSWEDTVAVADRETACVAYREMLESGRSETHLHALRKTGDVIEVHIILVRGLDASGSSIGFYCFMRELTPVMSPDEADNRTYRQAVEALSSLGGEHFFEQSAQLLADTLHFDLVAICECVREPVDEVKTLAIIESGKPTKNVQYSLRGTPCEQAVRGKPVFFRDRVQEFYPDDEYLKDINVAGYIAEPLCNSALHVIGHIVVMDSSPIENEQLVRPLLRVFSARIAVELERSHHYRELVESEERYRQVTESSQSVIWEVDRNLVFTWVNPVIRDLFSVAPGHVIGTSVLDHVHPDDRKQFLQKLKTAIDSGECFDNLVARIFHREGQVVNLDISGITLIDEAGDFHGLRGTAREISTQASHGHYVGSPGEQLQSPGAQRSPETGKSRILEAITTNKPLESVLRMIVESSQELLPDIICSILLLDKSGQYLRHGCAPGLPVAYNEAIDGVRIGNGAGSCGTAAFTGQRVIVTDIESDALWENYRELARKAGVRACWSQPIFSSDEKVLGTFAVYYREPREPDARSLEIIQLQAYLASIAIERDRNAETIREREETLRKYFNTVTESVVVARLSDGVIINVNHTFTEITGYKPDEVIGKSTVDLNLWVDPALRDELKQALIDNKVINNREYEFVVKGGKKVTGLMSATTIDIGGEQCVISTTRDITQWRDTELALRESENRLQHLIMACPDTVFLTRVNDGIILDVNDSFEEATGFSREEAVGQTTLELGLWPSPEDRERYINSLLENGNVKNREIEYRRKEGAHCHALVTATVNVIDGEQYAFTIARDITERKREQQRLEKVNRVLLNLGPNVHDNINTLVATAGALLDGSFALYNRLEDGDKIHTIAQWKSPNGFQFVSGAVCSASYDLIHSDERNARVIGDFQESDYAKAHPEFLDSTVNTYLGQAVYVDGKAIGALCVVYDRKFMPTEFDRDLFGILVSALGREEVRRIADRTLVNITRGVSASTGESFFDYLTNYLCISMDADYALVGCLSGDGKQVETVSVSVKGRTVENFSYSLQGTPGEAAMQSHLELCVHTDGVQVRFPDDMMLRTMNIQAYAGAPMKDANGKVVGLVSVLFTSAITKDLYFVEQPLAIFAARAEAELQRMGTVQALIKSEEKFRDAFGNAPTGITLIDREGKFLQTNSTMLQITGYDEDDLVASSMIDLVHPDDTAQFRNKLHDLVHGETEDFKTEIRLVTAGNKTIWVELHTSTVYDDRGLFMFAVTHVIDITDRVVTTLRLERSKRALQVLNDCNHGFARISNETNLLQYICEVIVATGKYRLAWVGYCQHDDKQSIKPMAHAGYEEGYLKNRFSWADDSYGHGPIGTAIRTLQPCIVRVIEDHPQFSPWRDTAMKRGYYACAAFPIIIETNVIGSLALYAGQAGAFDSEEVMLLNDLTTNLARGIQNIRVKTEGERVRFDLEASEQKFRMAFNNASMGMVIINKDGLIQEMNESAYKILDYVKGDLLGKPFRTITHPDDVQRSLEYFNKLYTGELEHYRIQKRYVQREGQIIYAILNASIIKDQDGKPDYMVAMIEDITQRRKAEQALQESEERFRTLYDDTPSMFFTIDDRGMIESVNEFGARELGYEVFELCRQEVTILMHPEDSEKVRAHMDDCRKGGDNIYRMEYRMVKKSGNIIWVRETMRMIREDKDIHKFLIVCEDISEIKRLSSQLTYQASHDALTGLVNRLEFERRLERVIKAPDTDDAEHALCFLDMDQFKVINDSCGHLAGDELLRQLSEVISASVRKRDTLARLGGDEFGILMEHCSLDKAKRVAGQILRKVEEFRFLWENKRFSLGVSIGLVPIVPGSSSVTSILKEADAACYAAKDAGRNRIHVYQSDDSNLTRIRGEMQWVSIINEAIEEDHLLLFKQDIKPLFTSGPTGRHYELLVRLRADDGHVVQPGAFMPAAERYNLSPRIDTWVIKTFLKWLHDHPEHVDELTKCTINLSGLSLSNTGFVDIVLEEFNRYDLPGEKVCFEITETAAIQNMSNAVKFMQLLKEIGCSFALDDFGSGVSSFAYLKQIPVDYIKIDGSFVRDMTRDQVNFEMVRAVNDIARVMGIQTIAEFVESEEILLLLQGLGVPFGQGYFIHKPEPLIKQGE